MPVENNHTLNRLRSSTHDVLVASIEGQDQILSAVRPKTQVSSSAVKNGISFLTTDSVSV